MKFILSADRNLHVTDETDFYEVLNLYEAHKRRRKEEDKLAETMRKRK